MLSLNNSQMPARDLPSYPRRFPIHSQCRKFNLALTPSAEPSQRLFRMKCDGRHPYSGVVSNPQSGTVDTVGFPGFPEPMFLHVGCARNGESIGNLCYFVPPNKSKIWSGKPRIHRQNWWLHQGKKKYYQVLYIFGEALEKRSWTVIHE